MPQYQIAAKGKVREVYSISADSEVKASKMFIRGEVGRPIVIESEGMEIVSISELKESI